MSFFDTNYTKVDKSLMEEGAPVDFGGGFTVTIRHVSSQAVEAEQNKVRHRMRIKRGKTPSADQAKEISKHVAAHAGIVGWKGGDAPEFSPEKALEIFEERPEFLEDVLLAMTEYETFREQAIEEGSGNSSS